MRVHPLAPVIALDLDGTLSAYHEHFIWFAELYLQESLRTPVWSDGLKGEFSDALRMEKHLYRDIKLAYRAGGMKRCMPVLGEKNPGDLMVEIQLIRSYGIQVWIATTRPYMRLDNIDPDTRFWLSRNTGQVDGIIYGEEKYSDLIDIVGKERILGVVDDLPENVEEATNLGLRTALRPGDHNRWWRGTRVNWVGKTGILDNITDLATLADEWKAEHDEGRR